MLKHDLYVFVLHYMAHCTNLVVQTLSWICYFQVLSKSVYVPLNRSKHWCYGHGDQKRLYAHDFYNYGTFYVIMKDWQDNQMPCGVHN
jgi:hypothetical protein